MRTICSAILLVTISAGLAKAAFNPDPVDICPTGSPTAERPIDPDSVLWKLLSSHGLSPPDLGIRRGDDSYLLRSNAILDPGGYCSTHKCSKNAERALTAVQGELLHFWQSNAHQPGPKDKFLTSPVAPDTNPNPVLEQFFRETKTVHAVCLAVKVEPSPPSLPPTTNAPDIRVRKSATDLSVKQNDKAFKGLDRATLSFVHDYVANTSTYDIEGVVGLALGPVQYDKTSLANFQLIPYGGYTRQLVQGGPKAKQTNVENFSAGLIGDWLFPVNTYFQDFQLYPQIVHSNRTNADVLSGNAVLTPDFPLPGIGGKYLPYQNAPFSFQLTLQAKTVFGQVLHAGSDPTLNASKNFVRIGPRVGITVFGETGIFAGWSASAMYEDQEVLQGQFKSVARFDSTLAYTMPGQEFWSLQLKYVYGRNLDTLERLQQISLGVGLKY